MTWLAKLLLLALAGGGVCWAARCTTVMDPRLLPEFEKYIAAAERNMQVRFESGELAWLAEPAHDVAARLAGRKLVRSNIGSDALNRRLADWNGAVTHWIGAVRIRAATLGDLRTVLEDHTQFVRVYRPVLFNCRAGSIGPRDLVLGMQNSYRFAGLFPQHYSFQVNAAMEYTRLDNTGVRVKLVAREIRESDSGVPGRADLLDQYHDHGIMWALHAYWRARQHGPNVYLEFESITLARSAQTFACKIGPVPVPKSVISAAMDSIPAESVTVILSGTQAECERRARSRTTNALGP